jgi:glycosyltransferase involved in cell wall biosynthesis
MSEASVSIVVPVYNERENLRPLYEEVVAAMRSVPRTWELIFVDDGSTDQSTSELEAIAVSDRRVRVVSLRRNFGQTSAMSAGIDMARCDIIVTLDGDRQNDPADIPRLVDELESGPWDMVHGWRKHRQDRLVSRKIPSRVANWLIGRATGFQVHDLGCTLRAVRSEFAKELRLYGELHRFIPILAFWQGARVKEMVTNHRPRVAGTSKYGIWRTVRVVLDLVTVKFLVQYSSRPMQLFGGVGLACIAASFLSLAATLIMRTAYGVDMTGNPLLLLTACAGIAALQFFVLGLLAEMGTRTYHESQNRRPYQIRALTNFNAPEITMAEKIALAASSTESMLTPKNEARATWKRAG